jgi:hypothetical protein
MDDRRGKDGSGVGRTIGEAEQAPSAAPSGSSGAAQSAQGAGLLPALSVPSAAFVRFLETTGRVARSVPVGLASPEPELLLVKGRL